MGADGPERKAIPYIECPECGLNLYRAAAWKTGDECPYCLAPLFPDGLTVAEDAGGRLWGQDQPAVADKALRDSPES
jgi:hypothetical protein